MTALSDAPPARAVWLSPDDCRVEDLQALVVPTELRDYPHAAEVVDNVLVYDCDRLRRDSATPEGRLAVQAEITRALMDGPGLTVYKGAFPEVSVVDLATEAFFAMVEEQHASGAVAGDHFAKPGANDRVWNALEKLAVREPEVFVRYYANEVLELVATAWPVSYTHLTLPTKRIV